MSTTLAVGTDPTIRSLLEGWTDHRLSTYVAYGRRSTGKATLRTGTPPGVAPISVPACAWPWIAMCTPAASSTVAMS